MGILRVIRGCFHPLLRRAHREGESHDEYMRKELLVPVSTVLALIHMPYIYLKFEAGAVAGAIQSLVVTAFCVGLVTHVLITREMGHFLSELCIMVTGPINLLILDLRTHGQMEGFATLILSMDSFLLTNSRKGTVTLARNMAILHIILLTLEQSLDLGIFTVSDRVFATDPPKCDDRELIPLMQARLLVFCADFAMTRHFASGMLTEQERMKKSIEVTHMVAQRLVDFDLDGGERLVEENGDQLPDELYEVLCGLLKNLKTYRPYLPQSCLPNECRVDESNDEASQNTNSQSEDALESSANHGCPGSSDPNAKSTTVRPGHGEMVRKHISLAAVNVRGFIAAVREGGAGELTAFYSRFLSGVVSAARAWHGQCELVSGDHVLCTFNAAKPLVTHRMHSTRCAKALESCVSGEGAFGDVAVSIGVSSGESLCGALGCEWLVRYAMVGVVGSWVHVVERTASEHGISVLIDDSVRNDVVHSFHTRLAWRVHSKHRGKDVLLWYPSREKQAEDEEWMYQLSNSVDDWEGYNAAMRAALDGDFAEALSLAQNLDMSVPENAALRETCARGCWPPLSPSDVPSL